MDGENTGTYDITAEAKEEASSNNSTTVLLNEMLSWIKRMGNIGVQGVQTR